MPWKRTTCLHAKAAAMRSPQPKHGSNTLVASYTSYTAFAVPTGNCEHLLMYLIPSCNLLELRGGAAALRIVKRLGIHLWRSAASCHLSHMLAWPFLLHFCML